MFIKNKGIVMTPNPTKYDMKARMPDSFLNKLGSAVHDNERFLEDKFNGDIRKVMAFKTLMTCAAEEIVTSYNGVDDWRLIDCEHTDAFFAYPDAPECIVMSLKGGNEVYKLDNRTFGLVVTLMSFTNIKKALANSNSELSDKIKNWERNLKKTFYKLVNDFIFDAFSAEVNSSVKIEIGDMNSVVTYCIN